MIELIQVSGEQAVAKAFAKVSQEKQLAQLPKISDGQSVIDWRDFQHAKASSDSGNRNIQRQIVDDGVGLGRRRLFRKLLTALLEEVTESNFRADDERQLEEV